MVYHSSAPLFLPIWDIKLPQIFPDIPPVHQVMASDVEALEEIETWRQMIGLEELQAGASAVPN